MDTEAENRLKSWGEKHVPVGWRSWATFAAAVVYGPEDASIVFASSITDWPDQLEPPPGLVKKTGVNDHAERKILMHALASEKKIYFVASTNVVCSVCAAALEGAGVERTKYIKLPEHGQDLRKRLEKKAKETEERAKNAALEAIQAQQMAVKAADEAKNGQATEKKQLEKEAKKAAEKATKAEERSKKAAEKARQAAEELSKLKQPA